MKRVLGVFLLAITFNIGYLNLSEAQNEYQCENLNGQKICFAKELMGELVKEAIYHVGSKALDKMKTDETNSNTSNNSTTTTSSSSYSNYVDNSSNSSNTDVQEEMIPI